MTGILQAALALLCSVPLAVAAGESAPIPLCSISGIVLDESGDPVAGSRVSLRSGAWRVTDETGRFRFENLEPSPEQVTVLARGFHETHSGEIDLAERCSVEVDLRLAPRTALEQSLVVTGTKSEYSVAEAPVPTALVTGLQCRRLATRTLAEALTATVTGIRIENTCTNCGALALRLNGLQGAYTQILEDGLPTLSGVSMVYALDQIPTDLLDAIEVVKGGASALYGPNAVAGVINLVRREPRNTSFQVDAQSGWLDGKPSRLAGTHAQSDALPMGFSGDLHYRALHRAPVDHDRDGFTDLARRKSHAAGGTLFRRFMEGSARLSFGGNLLTEFRRGGDQLHLPPEETLITEMADTRRTSMFLRWNHTVSPSTFWAFSAGGSSLHRDSYYGTAYDPNAYGHTENPAQAADIYLGRQEGPHTILAGYQFSGERVSDHFPAYNRLFDETYRNHGLYVQDEFRLRNRVVLVTGLRADKSNLLSYWVWSPRGNLRIGIGDRWSVRTGVSTGFRAPVIYDEDLHIAAVGGQGFVLANSPALGPERSRSWTASLDYNAAPAGMPFQVTAGMFVTRLRDVHVLQEEPGADFRRLLRVNGSGSRIRGLEVDFSLRARQNFGLRGGFTAQTARFDEPEPQFGSLDYFRSPNRYGFLAADWDLPKGIALLATSDFSSSMLVPHYAGYIPEDRLARVKGFGVLNLMASRTFRPRGEVRTAVRIYLKCNNVFDTYQRDLDRGPLRDAGHRHGPLTMRETIAGTTLTF